MNLMGSIQDEIKLSSLDSWHMVSGLFNVYEMIELATFPVTSTHTHCLKGEKFSVRG